jgi:hypothetical protein
MQKSHKRKELEFQLGHLAAEWAKTQKPALIKRYHDIYHELRSLGWDDVIDIEAELPDELMPQEYLNRFNVAHAGD